MEAAEIFAKRAKRRLEELNMTHEALARRLGVARPQVSKALTGENAPRIDTLLRWADALGCSVEHLLGRDVDVYDGLAERDRLLREIMESSLATSDLETLRMALTALTRTHVPRRKVQNDAE